MYQQYALTQVCSVHLTRGDIEKILVENLLARGGDPSYDFARSHPIFVWDAQGECSIRFVQEAVLSPEDRRWLSLKPVPTARELDKVMQERRDKIEADLRSKANPHD